MPQYFLDGDDESLDRVIAEAMAQLLDEAQRVIDDPGRPRADEPASGLACHPALDIDRTEGDAGFSDWLSDQPPPANGFAA
jgi:hypothetical protein